MFPFLRLQWHFDLREMLSPRTALRLSTVTLRFGSGSSIAALSEDRLSSSLADQVLPRFLAHLVQNADNTTHFLSNSDLGLSLALSRFS